MLNAIKHRITEATKFVSSLGTFCLKEKRNCMLRKKNAFL